METTFPETTGYAGSFVVGLRRMDGVLQRTGTVVLKRTYDYHAAGGTLTPSAAALPVFVEDQPDNRVKNGDFESELDTPDQALDTGTDSDWLPEETVTATRIADPEDGDLYLLALSGTAGARLTQTITVGEPLGGRTFSLSLRVAADDSLAHVDGVRLEAEGEVLCTISRDLETTMSPATATGTWPADLEATEMQVVLRMADDDAHTVFYDKVQVEERAHATLFDPFGRPRYENDLAPYKPEGDLVLLGVSTQIGTIELLIDGEVRLSHDLSAVSPPPKAALGWEPRDGDTRKDEAAFPLNDEDYPLPEALPALFDNRYFNGYRRGSLVGPTLPYPAPDATIEVARDGVVLYTFNLPGDGAAATFYFHGGNAPDDESHWHSRAVSMELDTLVLEPEAGRCYAVWRGVWPFDDHPEDAYRRLAVTATGPTS